MGLADDVVVDYWAAKTIARNVVRAESGRVSDVDPVIIKLLSTELLRDVAEDFALAERGQWDRLRLLALERVAAACLEAGDALAAIEIALVAAGIDELAEKPNQILFSSHITLGDTVAARRVYLEYEEQVRRSLGVDPSPVFRDLVCAKTGGWGAQRREGEADPDARAGAPPAEGRPALIRRRP